MHIQDLPNELLQKIFKPLSFNDKVEVSMVCRRWFGLVFETVQVLTCDHINMWPTPSYYEDGIEHPSMYRNLNHLTEFYNKTFKTNESWWDLFKLFPKVEKLEILVPELEKKILDAVLTYFRGINYLFLSIEPTEFSYDWREFGGKLSKLKTLKIEYLTQQEELCELSMIKASPSLRQVDLAYAAVTDEWRKLIPANVTTASFKLCSDTRSSKNDGLFDFILEDPKTLLHLAWEDTGRLQADDLKPLSNLKRIELKTNVATEAVVFEKLKELEYASFKVLYVKNLSGKKHILKKLRELKVQTLYGKAEDLRLFCPSVQVISTQNVEDSAGDS